MADSEVKQQSRKRRWARYLPIGMGILSCVIAVVVALALWNKVQQYGYLTSFLVSFLDGVTIIPLPAGVIVFILAGRLNPLYLGLLAGLGDALGGVTAYYTGAGGRSLWSKLRPKSKQRALSSQSNSNYDKLTSVLPKLPSRWQALYRRLLGWVERGGSWAVFVVAAFIWWLYYPVALAAGTFHIGVRRFFLASWAGKTIRGLIVAFAGYWGLRFILQWIGG